MGPRSVSAALARSDLGWSLSARELEQVAAAGVLTRDRAGATLLRERETGDSMLVLVSGSAVVVHADRRGTEQSLATVGPGSLLGECGMLRTMPRMATVRAETEVEYFVLDRASFDRLAEEHPRLGTKLALEVARCLARRLEGANKKLLRLMGPGATGADSDAALACRRALMGGSEE